MNKKISVIIPARNEAKTLPVLLKALQNQTFKPIEIIVVDNASTDNTSAITKSFGVKIIHENMLGTNNALETGRKQITGDLIARIDADCIPHPNWIMQAASHFENSKVVAVAGPCDYYDGGWILRNTALYIQKTIYTLVNLFLRSVRFGGIIIGGNSMMRSTALDEIGGFNRNITFYGDDTDLAKRISRKGMIVFDRNLLMKTSARRFQTEGSLKIFFKYIKEFINMTIKA
jgi:glycosyltransferase involved in cell wall biosynthesis